jgi:hypothetical protein
MHSKLSKRGNNVQFENLTMEALITVLVTLKNFLCNFFNDAASTADYMPLGDLVRDELENIWKAAVRT